MINRVILIGRLTKNAELKSTPNGKSVTNFTLAVQRDKETSDFINCTAWNKTAEILTQYTSKGSLVAVEGRLQVRSYDSNGQTKYATEVICDSLTLCDSKPKEEKKETPLEVPADKWMKFSDVSISDEELPF